MMHKETQQLLDISLQESDTHLSYERILEGISAGVAGKKVENSPYTIWQILNHLHFTQQRYLGYLRGEGHNYSPSVEEFWPGSDQPTDQKEVDQIIKELTGMINTARELLLSGQELQHPENYASTARVFQCMAVHYSYHLGQVMLLRRIIGDYPPPSGAYIW